MTVTQTGNPTSALKSAFALFEKIFVHNRTGVIIACLYVHVLFLLLGLRGREDAAAAAVVAQASWSVQTGAELLDASVREPLTREAVLFRAKVTGRAIVVKQHHKIEGREVAADMASINNSSSNDCWGPALLFAATLMIYAFIKCVLFPAHGTEVQPIVRQRAKSVRRVASMAQELQEQVLRTPLHATVRAASRSKLE